MEYLEEKDYKVYTGGLWPGFKCASGCDIEVASLHFLRELITRFFDDSRTKIKAQKVYRLYTSGLGPGFKSTLGRNTHVGESTGDRTGDTIVIISTS
mgnify:CR=1 FL=1